MVAGVSGVGELDGEMSEWSICGVGGHDGESSGWL